MIVLIEEIHEGGLEVEDALGEHWLAGVLSAEVKETGFRPLGSAIFKARFDRIGDKLLLSGESEVYALSVCRRCLADVKVKVPVRFELNLVPREPASDEGETGERAPRRDEEASFDPESADEELFDGRQIDLGAIAREQILLAMPMDVVCKEDCRGLCSVCGQDLNAKECGCQRKVTDPRWAALQDIKLKK
jgi:uncharacterized protein